MILIFSLLIAYKKDFEKKFIGVATKVAWLRTCQDELNERIGSLKKHVLPFLMLVFSETGGRSGDYQRLVTDVRPLDWQKLVTTLTGSKEEKNEIDSLSGFILGQEYAKHIERPVSDVTLKALEGEFDFIPNRIRDRFISEIRSSTAQKRTPPEGITSIESVGEVPVPEPAEKHSTGEIKRIVELAASDLRDAYGPKADAVILAFLLDPDADQALIAHKAEISDRQLRTYISKFKEDPKPITRLFEAM
jgi:hypothetical protein